MADWDQGDGRRFERASERYDERAALDGRNAPARRPGEDRPSATRDRFAQDDGFSRRDGRAPRPGGRGERLASYEAAPGSYASDGGGARGYGDGGDTAYGQMASGSSDSGLGGYGGADVGGWGQPNLNSQWGQGGYAPLNQGLDYGQDGGRFGPAGYANGDFGQHLPAPRHDEHHTHYQGWRDAQLANHDRDYARWRDEQGRRYDEDYGSWRQERHSAFSKEFEGWRSGRGGQSVSGQTGVDPQTGVNPITAGFAHGANPTLAKIAEGHEGHIRHPHDTKPAEDKADDTTS